MKNENMVTTYTNCPEGLSTLTYSELMDEAYEPHLPIISDLLYEGAYLFVGSPKVGKSFFMLQLAYHVATGEPLWGFKVYQSEVLYLALEDDFGRLQQRLSRMFGVDGTDHLHLSVSAGTINDGLIDQISSFLEKHPSTRLVLVDTLQKIRDEEGEGTSYKNDYEIMDRLKAVSDKYKVGLIVVHHCRKMEATDVFDQISGTNGLMGAADGAYMLIKKKRTDKKAELSVVGRDQASSVLYLKFDNERCLWDCEKHEMEMWNNLPDPLLELIDDFFDDGKEEWTGSTSELMDIIGFHEKTPVQVSKHLNAHVTELLRDYGIIYRRLGRTSQKRGMLLKRVSDQKAENETAVIPTTGPEKVPDEAEENFDTE